MNEYLNRFIGLTLQFTHYVQGQPQTKYKFSNWPEQIQPSMVNAAYIATHNQIALSASLFQMPIFSPNLPIEILYGGVGAAIGHEITHGFDNNGRKMDFVGNKKDWWSKNSAQKFDSKAKCYSEQYSKFQIGTGYYDSDTPIEENSEFELSDQRYLVNLDGNRTLGEDLADNGGIKLAYNAFLKEKNRGKISKSVEMASEFYLPGFKNITSNQLFFISFAHMWCGNENIYNYDLEDLEKIKMDVHPPSEDRIIGALQNFLPFREAFECSIGDPMAPEKVCKLW